jgi:guanylate kinase
MNQPSTQDACQGILFIVSAPSGAGKTTLCRALRRQYPDLLYSISHTTRPPRSGEQEGIDYFFITPDAFKKGIQKDAWAEWAQVHGHYYGTAAAFLVNSLAAGRGVLLDIDVQGMRQIVARFPDSVSIFIMPPSVAALKARLESRGTDSADAIARRLQNAQNEMAQRAYYGHVIVNDDLAQATNEFIDLFASYRTASGWCGATARRSGCHKGRGI